MLFPLSDRLISNRAVKATRVAAVDDNDALDDGAASDEDDASVKAAVLLCSDCRGSVMRGRP